MPVLTLGRTLAPVLCGGLWTALLFAAVGVALHGREPGAGLLAPALHYAGYGLASGWLCAAIDLVRRPGPLGAAARAAARPACGQPASRPAMPVSDTARAGTRPAAKPRRMAPADAQAARARPAPRDAAVSSAFGI